MIKFWITTRPQPRMDLEQLDDEWGVLHPSRMVTTPGVLNGSFPRYVQHRSVSEPPSYGELLFARSEQGRYSCADHLCPTYDDVIAGVTAGDYRRQIFPHRFSDKAMVVELS